MARLFDMCLPRCTCSEDNCGIRARTRPVIGDPVPQCTSTSCEVCLVFGAQKLDLYKTSLRSRNERLNQLLRCCPAIGDLYRLAKRDPTSSAEEQKARKTEVQGLLCQLVGCRSNRLNCMKNVGEMSEIAPRILCVQLNSGHSDFWSEIRKVAKAVNKQEGLECKLAALIAVCKRIPPGNHWPFYLACHHNHRVKERDILEQWAAASECDDNRA